MNPEQVSLFSCHPEEQSDEGSPSFKGFLSLMESLSAKKQADVRLSQNSRSIGSFWFVEKRSNKKDSLARSYERIFLKL